MSKRAKGVMSMDAEPEWADAQDREDDSMALQALAYGTMCGWMFLLLLSARTPW
jgi:hypothetical protein